MHTWLYSYMFDYKKISNPSLVAHSRNCRTLEVGQEYCLEFETSLSNVEEWGEKRMKTLATFT